MAKDYHHVGVPISSLTVEAIGGTAKDKGKNIYALGLIARMFDLNVPKLENSSANVSPARTRAC
jgi:2-oxoglutarate ferredoxin oxidoreductase subunit alpha